MENIKSKLREIIEHVDCDRPMCKNCISYKNGGCTFGCLNERMKITSANYSCDNFNSRYSYCDNTISAMKDLLKDVERVEEGMKNLELLLNGKIDEKEFVDFVD